MKLRTLLASILFLVGVVFLWLSTPIKVSSSIELQQVASPTPGPDGRIIYIVQAGDTCNQISLLYNVSVEYLRSTNHLDENCSLVEGKELVIGIGGPAVISPTLGPLGSPTPIQPTPTLSTSGTARVCVALYDDADGDGLRQANTDALGNYLADGTDPIIEGGALSLTGSDNPYSQTLTTSGGYDPLCFEEVPPGKYTVSAAVPDEYNPTTTLRFDLLIQSGDTIYVPFGAQSKTKPETGGSSGNSPILGIFGTLLLLSGIGMAIYAWRLRK